MKEKLIGVLMGGMSREREISLRSGKNVNEALQKLGYKTKIIDITKTDCQAELKASGIEVAYNILHGNFGEDGGIQAILEELKIPYTGSGVKASQNCMDKIVCKNILLKNSFPTAKFEQPLNAGQIHLAVPLVIKPIKEGSSFGVTIVHDESKLAEAFTKTQKEFGQDIFLEEFIKGVEITVGVINIENKIQSLPILELVPKNKFYDFESKYTPGGTSFILPADLSAPVTKLVQELAVDVYKTLHCSGGVRIDMILEDRRNPYILEVNTIPGMTDQSDLPAEAKAAGISFESLVEKILLTASLNKY